MSDEDSIDTGDRGDLLAAEYVLGVLPAEERRLAELRLTNEPRFAAEVAFWEGRLCGWAEEIPAVAPPSHIWEGIEDRLSASRRPAAGRAGIWQNLAFWRTFAISSAALAAASIVGLIYLTQIPSLGPPLLARLDEQSGQPGFLAAANPADGSVTVVPAALLTREQQRSYERKGDGATRAPAASHRRFHASDFARTTRRLSDGPADRSSDRQRQARKPVNS
jgi:anti-sigma-K factor RskA